MVCMAVLTGCSKTYKDIRVTSFEVISITPKGLNQVDALVDIGVYNPIIGFEVSGLDGILKMDGKPCVDVTSERIVVNGKTEQVYRIPLHGSIVEGFNPLSLLSVTKDMDFSAFTADVSAKVSMRGGLGKNIAVKDIKVGEIANKSKSRQ